MAIPPAENEQIATSQKPPIEEAEVRHPIVAVDKQRANTAPSLMTYISFAIMSLLALVVIALLLPTVIRQMVPFFNEGTSGDFVGPAPASITQINNNHNYAGGPELPPFDRAMFEAAVKHGQPLADLDPLPAGDPQRDGRIKLATVIYRDHPMVRAVRAIKTASGGPDRIIASKPTTWVALPDKLKRWCTSFDQSTLRQRLDQLYGFPPGWSAHSVLLEFEIKPVAPETVANEPVNIFRPCSDPRVYTSRCPIRVPETVEGVSAAAMNEHARWLLNHMLDSYRLKDASIVPFPFTGLGYTYDWSPENLNHVGLSEYVVKKDTVLHAPRIHELEAYCLPEKIAANPRR